MTGRLGRPPVAPETHAGPVGQGPVVVELGAELGTLVVYAPATMAGVELQIAPSGQTSPWRHVSVLARLLPAGTVHAAVYPALPTGRYTVWGHGPERLVVHVAAGVVTEARWPQAGPGAASAGPDPSP
jgi:hypothetical protein